MSGIMSYLSGSYHCAAPVRADIASKMRWAKHKHADEAQVDAFFIVRDRVLGKLAENGLLKKDHLDLILDFYIDTDIGIATFTHYDSKKGDPKESIDLSTYNDPEIIKALQFLRGEAESRFGKNLLAPKFANKSKGAAKGKEPLQKGKSEHVKGLATDFKKAAEELYPTIIDKIPNSAARKKIVKRHNFVEFYVSRLKEKVEEKIKQKEGELEQANQQPRSNLEAGHRVLELQKQLEHLNDLKERLDKLDIFALSVTCAAHPIGSIWAKDLDGSASYLEKYLTDDLLKKAQTKADNDKTLLGKGIDFVLRREDPKAQLTEEEKTYIQDVVGMLYTDGPKYLSYCKQHNISIKKEGLEDLLLREAIRFADGGDYEADGFKNSVHLADFPQALKSEMASMFDEISVLLSHAIPEDTGNYTFTPIDPKASEEDKKKAVEKQQQDIKKDIVDQRARVQWDMKELPPGAVVRAAGSAVGFVANSPYAWGTALVGLGATALAVWNYLSAAWNLVSSAWDLVATPFSYVAGPVGTLMTLSVAIGQAAPFMPSRKVVPVILGMAGVGGSLMYAGYIDPQILRNIVTFIASNPGLSAAMYYQVNSIPKALYNYMRPEGAERSEIATSASPERKWKKKRIAVVALSTLLALGAGLIAFVPTEENKNEPTLLSQGVSTASEYVWNNSGYVALAGLAPLAAANVPGLSSAVNFVSIAIRPVTSAVSYYTPGSIKALAGHVRDTVFAVSGASMLRNTGTSLFQKGKTLFVY